VLKKVVGFITVPWLLVSVAAIVGLVIIAAVSVFFNCRCWALQRRP
jgi:hypothetical protein